MIIVKEFLPLVMMVYYVGVFKLKKIKTNMLIFLYVGLFPYISSNFSFNSIYRYINQSMVIILTLLIVLQILTVKDFKIKYNVFQVSLFILALLSFFKATDIDYYGQGLTNFFSNVVIFTVLSSNVKENIDDILMTYRINGILLGILGIVEYIILKTRVETTFSNPNYLGLFLSISFITHYYNNKKNLPVLLIISIAIYFTGSRTTLIFILVPMLVSIYTKIKLYRTKFLFITLIISIFVMRINNIVLSFINYLHIQNDVSSLQRVAVFETSFQIIKRNPILGIGFNNFIVEHKDYLQYVSTESYLQLSRLPMIVTHNDFLKFATELGSLGLFVFISYFIRNIRNTLNVEDKNYREMCFSLLIVFLVFSLTHNNTNTMEFWLFTSLSSFFPSKKYLENSKINNLIQ